MAVVLCKGCRKMVEPVGQRCPNCGREHPSLGRLPRIIVYSVFFVVFTLSAVKTCQEKLTNWEQKVPHPSLIKITAAQLKRAYDENQVSGDNLYKGQHLMVTGSIKSIRSNFNGDIILSPWAGNKYEAVIANIDKTDEDKAAMLKKGQQIVLIGIGGKITSDDPILDNCHIQ